MISKKHVLVTLFIGFLTTGVAVWLGGQKTWELMGFSVKQDSTQETLTALEELLKDDPDEAYAKYNLAVVYYKQEKFKEAVDLLIDLLNSGKPGSKLADKIHYNLGNSFFRLSEQEDDLTEMIRILEQSLIHFRTVMDRQKQASKYTDATIEQDEDVYFNYLLVRTKLKLLNDKLQQQRQEQEQEKKLYQLVKELRDKEKNIADQLGSMKHAPLSKQSLNKREELLKLRKENLEQYQIIKEKLLQSLSHS